VQQRYEEWLAEQEAAGRAFTEEQRWWLDRIAEAIGVNLSVRAEDFPSMASCSIAADGTPRGRRLGRSSLS
jgi:hypothetical protein